MKVRIKSAIFRGAVTACTTMLLAGLFCAGCAGRRDGGQQDILKEETSDGYPEEMEDFNEKTFGTDRKAIMKTIKTGKPEVEDDEKRGDNPECMESCKAESGLFHLDIFDNKEKPENNSDGTYMIRVYFDRGKLQEAEGKNESLQLLQVICRALNLPYEEETLWGYLEKILENDILAKGEYKENAYITAVVEGDSEIRFDLSANS